MDALGGIRLGRSSILAEVADLVAFLISPRAAPISGTEYLIDGARIALSGDDGYGRTAR